MDAAAELIVIVWVGTLWRCWKIQVAAPTSMTLDSPREKRLGDDVALACAAYRRKSINLSQGNTTPLDAFSAAASVEHVLSAPAAGGEDEEDGAAGSRDGSASGFGQRKKFLDPNVTSFSRGSRPGRDTHSPPRF